MGDELRNYGIRLILELGGDDALHRGPKIGMTEEHIMPVPADTRHLEHATVIESLAIAVTQDMSQDFGWESVDVQRRHWSVDA
jgi:hypothetical protein